MQDLKITASSPPRASSLSEKRARLLELFRATSSQVKRYPLSSGQRRLWFLSHLNPESTAYHIISSVILSGEINVVALEQALQEIVRRHEVLRASFVLDNNQPSQLINAPAISLEIADLTGLGEQRATALAAEFGQLDVERPFELSHGPLLRERMFWFTKQDCALILTLHHIVSDGLSQQILMSEMTNLYEQYSAGEPSHLSELEIGYGDYARWQQQWLESSQCQAQLTYWKTQLSDLEPLALPMDRSRPVVPLSSGATEILDLKEHILLSMRELRTSETASFYMLLLAAFAVLLSRYSGQSEFAVGTTVANRTHPETQAMIGLFANTLALKMEVNEWLTYRQLVKEIKKTCLGAYENQEIPFDKLIEELHPQRDLSRNPLFQVAFLLLETQRFQARLGNARFGQMAIRNRTSKFDWTLEIHQYEHVLQARLEYNTELFAEDTIRRALLHFQHLLKEFTSHPDKPIWQVEFPKVTEAEDVTGRRDLHCRRFEAGQSVPEMVEFQSKLRPDAVAVSGEGEFLTYDELNGSANALAHQLRANGVGPESIVAVHMNRRVEMVIALLGIWKAGAAYLPLDLSYPTHRLHSMLSSQPVTAVLVHHSEKASCFVDSAIHIIAVDRAALKPVSEPPVVSDPGQLAYVIYTSGTTGSPKGVMIEHRAIANHMRWMQTEFPLTPNDAVLQKTPMTFDASVWEFWAPLIVGGRLVLADPGRERDGTYLIGAIRRHAISVLQVVPLQLDILIECGLSECSTLKRVFCGGGILSGDSARQFYLESAAELVNLYGPTEATIDATFKRVDRGDNLGGPVPIGQPIANVQTYIHDRFLRLVPSGAYGELWIAGDAVARGYLEAPDLTAERFLPDPYAILPGARMYATGDICRLVSPGVLGFCGRRDDQIKFRGYRIELAEIESLLLRHSDVRRCAVALKNSPGGRDVLVAYIVSATYEAPDISALQIFIRAHLPEYMVPTYWMRIEQLPLTSSGKLDRRKLPELPNQPLTVAQPGTSIPTEVESTITRIWCEILGLTHVSPEDNFFDAGGDSLQLTLLSKRLTGELNREVSVLSLFQFPTISSFIASLETQGAKGTPTDTDNPSHRLDAGLQRKAQRMNLFRTQ